MITEGPAHAIEENFTFALDGCAADAHKLRLQCKVAPSQKVRSAWSTFIMSQCFRTPEGVCHVKQAMLSLLAKDSPALSKNTRR